MTEIDLVHHNPLTPLGPRAWNWEIPIYLFLGGLTAGLMILTALLDRRLPAEKRSRWTRYLVLGAPILLSLGMLALWLDLESRWRAYRFYLVFRWSSPMSWGAWILMAIYPATLLFFLTQLTDEEADKVRAWRPLALFRLGGLVGCWRSFAQRHQRGLRTANLVLGIALGGYTGILLSTLGARAAWNSSLLGPLFLVSGFSTGAALLMLFPMAKDEHHLLRGWDVLAIVAELALLGLFIVGLLSSSAFGREAAGLFLGGKLTAHFWSLVVIAGLLVPLALELFEAKKGLAPTRYAPALLLVGGLSLRWILVVAGQVS